MLVARVMVSSEVKLAAPEERGGDREDDYHDDEDHDAEDEQGTMSPGTAPSLLSPGGGEPISTILRVT
jgi:hypothetical protein